MSMKSIQSGDTYMKHHSHYNDDDDGKEDDPCDDWSHNPIPKPKDNKE